MKLKDIAEHTGGRIIGDTDVDISGVAGIEEAQHGDITFIAARRKLPPVSTVRASAIITKEEITGLSASLLLVDNPHLVFAKVLEFFYRKPYLSQGVSNKAYIGKNVDLGEETTIHPHAFIGNNTVIGARSIIFPNAYIGDDVVIGDNSVIHPSVTIGDRVTIGSRVIIHPGTVIGSDGFGYAAENGKHYKIPQVGGVIIEDDVEIGSNVSIDRATTGNTIIGCGTKIDNLVQIAHNVKIGKHCIIVGQSGVAGSVEIGNGTMLGGQTAVRDHVKIGNGVRIGGGSGVVHNIPDGQTVSGRPAIPHNTWLRAQAMYAKLPEYIKRLHALENQLIKEGSSHD